MENYVLHDSLNYVSSQYLIKTLNTEAQKLIISSVFRDGSLIKSSKESYNGHRTEEELFLKVRDTHETTKFNIKTLFKLANKFTNSDLIGKRILVGRAFINNQMYKEAILEFDKILLKSKNYSIIHFYLGKCHFQLQQFDKAAKCFNDAVKLNKNYADYHYNLGRAFLELGKCKSAVQEFMHAINLNAYYHQAYYHLALAYLQNAIKKEDFNLACDVIHKAEKFLIKAVQIFPDYHNDAFSQGLQELKNDNILTALDCLKQSYAEEENYNAQQKLMIDFYIKYLSEDEKLDMNYIKTYMAKLKSLIKIYPKYADLHYELGIAKIIMSKVLIFQSIGNFETALSINKNFSKAEKKRTLLKNEQKGINTLLLNLLEP